MFASHLSGFKTAHEALMSTGLQGRTRGKRLEGKSRTVIPHHGKRGLAYF